MSEKNPATLSKPFSLTDKTVWVAGHHGMVGAAIVRRLAGEGCRVITASRQELDLTRQDAVERWVDRVRPDAIFLAAARVGGIHANDAYPVDFLHDNLAIEINVLRAAKQCGVGKLLLLGSSCIYPRLAEQPMREEALLTGPLEPTNEWYAIAKIAGIKLCQAYRRQHGCDFISCMPTNLYGPGDNYHPENSHVPAALIRRCHEARRHGDRQVEIWGSGRPLREFLHVDDLADACVFLMQQYSGDGHINVGTGQEVSIAAFAETVAAVVGFQGELVYDTARPDGTPRKLLDVSRLTAMGWTARIPLRQGLEDAYRWFLDHQGALRQV